MSMKWIRSSLSSFGVFLALAPWSVAQEVKPHIASVDKKQLQSASGQLRLLSSSEANIVRIDEVGSAKTLIFAIDSSTTCERVSVGDTVYVIYAADGSKNTAVSIVLAHVPETRYAGPVGGVAHANQPQPMARPNSGPMTAGKPSTYHLQWEESAEARKDLQQKLAEELAVTTLTPDRSDLLKPGAVFVLQKTGLAMTSVAAPIPSGNTYIDGRFSKPLESGFGSLLGKRVSGYPKRTFVAGEKFWLTGVAVENDGVLYQFYSDPYDGIRYYGQVKVPFARGTVPAITDLMKELAEVVTVQPLDNATYSAPVSSSPASAPAPSVQPTAVMLDQTKDQVVAIFGAPQRIVKLGAKEIYFYPKVKIVFLNGKVSDMEEYHEP